MQLSEIIDYRNFTYNWDYIERIPEFAKLKECEQSPKWHKEGNAWIHTRNVCEEAVKICKDRNWEHEPHMALLLLASALFHDIGKGTTTNFIKGGWHSYGHEMAGEKITRLLLWENDIEFREHICSLVRWHMYPLDILKSKSPIESIANISRKVYIFDLLLLLKECDIRGSIQEDIKGRKEDLFSLRKLRYIASLLDSKYHPFPSMKDIDIRLGKDIEAKYHFYVMIGLPGSGKSTKAEEIKNMESLHGPCIIVSRDAIRYELGYCGEGEKVVCTKEQENEVSDMFNDRVSKFINENPDGGTVIIDNINLVRTYRKNYHLFATGPNAVKFTYVYVQADTLEKNLERRAKDGFTMEMLKEMAMRLDWPDVDEYEELLIEEN